MQSSMDLMNCSAWSQGDGVGKSFLEFFRRLFSSSVDPLAERDKEALRNSQDLTKQVEELRAVLNGEAHWFTSPGWSEDERQGIECRTLENGDG